MIVGLALIESLVLFSVPDLRALGALTHPNSLDSWLDTFLNCKIFNWPYSIDELLEVELGVSIQVDPSDDGNKEVFIWKYAALDQKSLEVDLINVFVVPVVNGLE